jgi:hypothetical protein
VNLPVWGGALARQAEARLDRAGPKQAVAGIAPDFRPVLEPMAGTAADQQHIRHVGMKIDQEIAIRAVFILADLGAGQWRVLQERKAAVAEGDDFGKRGLGRFAALCVRIDDWSPVGGAK